MQNRIVSLTNLQERVLSELGSTVNHFHHLKATCEV